MKIVAPVALVLGLPLLLASPMKEAMRHLSEFPPSLFVVAGLIPLMLAGQLLTTKKRSRVQ